MTRLKLWLLAAAVVLVALAGFQWWTSRGQDKKADKDVAASIVIDASRKTETAASAHVDTVVDTVYLGEKKHKAAADSLKRVADTLGQHAVTLRDTAGMWHLRWQLRGVALEQDSVALVAADLRADSLAVDRLRWHVLADSAVASQDRLRVDLGIARSGCKVLPFVPCLSRKQTAIVAFAAGVVVTRRYWRN